MATAGTQIQSSVNSMKQDQDLTVRRTIPPASSTITLDKSKNLMDEHYSVQLRVATIENPLKSIQSPISKDPADTTQVVNENTGKVCLRYNDLNVGAINPNGTGKRLNSSFSYPSEDRTFNELANTDTRPIVPITYPYMFTNAVTWCGINFLPLVGSKVIIAFGKSDFPYILGYLAEKYVATNPPLMPGEICIKGYGGNYIHWRWSNKIDIIAKAKQGSQDLDDSSGGKTANSDSRVAIQLDADNGTLTLMVGETGIRIQRDGVFVQTKGASSFALKENSLDMQVQGGSSISVDKESVGFTSSGSVNVNAPAYNNNAARNDSN